jgi:hypothetical protein
MDENVLIRIDGADAGVRSFLRVPCIGELIVANDAKVYSVYGVLHNDHGAEVWCAKPPVEVVVAGLAPLLAALEPNPSL